MTTSIPKRIAIVGTGAMGSIYAALLADAGHDVWAVDAWAEHQRFARLAGSLNPAHQPRLSASVYQRHYAGGRDRTVPVEVTRRGAPAASLVVLTDYDHRCCWTALWPTVLSDLERRAPARSN